MRRGFLFMSVVLCFGVLLGPIQVKAGENGSLKRWNILARNLRYHPDTFSVEPGQTVQMTLRNEGFVAHNLVVPSISVRSDTVQHGKLSTRRIPPVEMGGYRYGG